MDDLRNFFSFPEFLKSDERVVPVFYATDRGAARSESRPIYNAARSAGGRLRLGRFDIRIPESHELGKVERPGILTLFLEDQKSHLVIRRAVEQSYEDFYRDVSTMVGLSPRREAFVFIHGYNVSFDDAIYRTAQIAWDLKFKGASILYSWPSLGLEEEYRSDYTNNEWTVPHLQWFLEDVVKRSGASVIHLIAHSMGNRALVYALKGMSNARVAVFNQIVLAAPDIDADTFLDIANSVSKHGQRTTLYASSEDVALKLSARFHVAGGTYRRAGDILPEPVVVDGIDTIDASGVDTSLLGHSYYGSNRSVLTDIYALITQNQSPSQRFGIRPAGIPPKQYWEFMK
jgi:esterase/lipase superfamily enzyme